MKKKLSRHPLYELLKPGLTTLSVLTSMAGYYMASSSPWTIGDYHVLFWMTVGTALVGGGAGVLNQYIERINDQRMKRTESRPLPSGRICPVRALILGVILTVAGIIELIMVIHPLCGLIAGLISISYLLFYTPLKQLSPLSTLVGGIPGALPPLIGWTAVTNSLSIEAGVLFLILFFWQMPHFLSLSWIYKKDYIKAGFKMLSGIDEQGTIIGRQIVVNCAALFVASLLPTIVKMTGIIYFTTAFIISLSYLVIGIQFSMAAKSDDHPSRVRINFYARRLFFFSLIYLPVLFTVMVADKR